MDGSPRPLPNSTTSAAAAAAGEGEDCASEAEKRGGGLGDADESRYENFRASDRGGAENAACGAGKVGGAIQTNGNAIDGIGARGGEPSLAELLLPTSATASPWSRGHIAWCRELSVLIRPIRWFEPTQRPTKHLEDSEGARMRAEDDLLAPHERSGLAVCPQGLAIAARSP
jgi:hypothetical protein